MLSRQDLLMLKPKAPFFSHCPSLPAQELVWMKICTKGGDNRDSAADVLVPPILIVHQGTPRDGKSPSRSLETLSSTQQLQLGPFFHPQNNKSSLFQLKSDFFSWVETGQYIQRQQNPTPCPKYFSPAVLLNQTD